MAKILVVDDEKIIRDRLASILSLDGYETVTAEDGKSALILLESDKPNIVILDIKMPGMDGIEVLKHIKKRSKITEVIMITGHGGIETAIDAMKEDAFCYIQKPVDYDELEINIKKALEKQSLEYELERYVHRLEDMVKEWETTFDPISDMVSILDTNFRVIKGNKAFWDGIGEDKNNCIGSSCHTLCHDMETPHSNCAFKKTIVTKKSTTEEIYEPKLGIYLEITTSPIFDKDNNVTGCVHISKNITQRKLYETNLKEAKEAAEAGDRAKSEFLSNMSHEIRTPLNGIIGTIELLLNTPLNHEQKSLLSLTIQSVESLQLLMDSVLDIVDITTGKIDLLKIRFNLREMIKNTVESLTIKAKQKGLRFSYIMDNDIPIELYNTPELIKQALTHIIDNAIKFTQVGEVQLIIKKDVEDKLLFTVIDTGIGILQDKYEEIFKSFVQVDMSFARKYGGAGLGLSIAKKIINILGGRLWVESEIGVGSKFHFTLNITDLINETSSLIENVGILKNLSIMIVDNDIINCAICKEILKSEGAVANVASSGQEAIQIIKQSLIDNRPYNAVMIELNLYDIQTLKLVKIIREDDELKNIKIILMSTESRIDEKEWVNYKIASYLQKPINKSLLINTLIKPDN